ncbi:MAG TPA: hypothetical protein VLI05_01620 [Candidatus Saccharimonadia bacterium]|nr:hypothetical protein [Candidatus Saccharimonadia bacterium]
MEPQNSPVVACERELKNSTNKVTITLRSELTGDTAAVAQLCRMIQVLVPHAQILDGQGRNRSVLEVRPKDHDYRNLAALQYADVDQLNARLAELTGDTVLAVTRGNLPMQVMVALNHRATSRDIDHLQAQLANSGVKVLNATLAEPRNLYDGFVLSLLVPQLDELDDWESFEEVVRTALAFPKL